MKSKYDYPPRQRRLAVHSLFIIWILIFILILSFSSCRPQRGCYGTRGMSGYSKLEKKFIERAGFGWLKCMTTGKVCILRRDGEIIGSYFEPIK